MIKLTRLPKLLLPIVAMFFFNFSQAQDLEFQLSTSDSGGGDSIRVDVAVQNWDSIYSFQYTIRWDTAQLTFLDVGNFNLPELDENSFGYSGVDDGFLISLWADLSVIGYDVADSTVIYSLFFTAPCASTDTTEVVFSNDPISILASTLEEEFVPDTLSGQVNFVPLLANSFIINGVNCNGAADGCIEMTPAGGTAPFTYLWSNGATSAEACGLSPGFYTCTVTDAGNCTAVSPSIEVTEPAVLDVCASSVTDVSCAGAADGCIDLTICGGTGPYSYLWSPGGQTDEDICGLVAGTYTCVVTDSLACTTSIMNVTVNEPPGMMLTNVAVVNATCSVGGSIDITIGGGDDPYTYLWSNGATTEDINNLVAGFYTCVVTDNNSCTFTTTAIEVVLENSDLTVSLGAQENVSCFEGSDGSIDLTVAGTATPFTYIWSNGAMTQDVDGLIAGTYTCTVTDNNGCVFVSPAFEITEPATALVVDNITVVDLSCFGGSDGCVTINVSGGDGPYSYLWSNGATTQEVCNLPIGNYSCIVTDANGCTITSAEATIDEPDLLEVCASSNTDVSCAGGSDACIDITPCGGTAPFTFLWTPGGATDEDICGLPAGTYSCLITDANNCTVTFSGIIIDEPAPIILENSTIVNATCAQGGSIDITLDGGTAPYTYLWSNGAITEDIADLSAGIYSCVVTDNASCVITLMDFEVILENSDLAVDNTTETHVSCFGETDGSIDLEVSGSGTPFTYLWSNGAVTQDVDNLGVGIYSCVVTDVDGCELTTSNIEITGPDAALEVESETVVDVSCAGENNGSITINIAGGTPPYSYAWSNGGEEATIDNLSPGMYNCVITDANDCVVQSVVYEINELPAIVVSSFELVNATCANGGASGSIDISVEGGMPMYTYEWSNGATTEDLTDLTAGIYNCTITDDANCIVVTQTFTIELDGGDLSLDNVTSENVNCIGGSDGSITLDVSGTAMPITFAWSNGASSQNLMDLTTGTYSCIITDGNGCTVTTSIITIDEPDTGVAVDNLIGNNSSCFDSDDGSIDLEVSGGTEPYAYLWSNGAITEDIDNLPTGDYTCTITDDNGCIIMTNTITITAPESIGVELISSNDASCGQGGDNGSIDIDVAGGTPTYTYLWSNGATTQDLMDIPAGDYTCTITDQAMCTFVTPVYTIVNLGSNLSYNGAVTGNVDCFGDDNGFVDIDVTGTATPLTYQWSNGETTEDLSDLQGGEYTCTITNANGCTTTTPLFMITAPEFALDATVLNVTNTCTGTADGSISIEVSGGTEPYGYLWTNGGTTAEITGLEAGIYSCIVTDANGCLLTTIGIEVENAMSDLTITGNEVGQVNCFGESTGFVNLDVTGSATPLTFAWSNGAETEDISDLPIGNYSCVITDGNGCTVMSDLFIINSPDELEVELISLVNTSCGQGDSGSIDIEVNAGTPGYEYLWSNGATTQDLNAVSAGIYNCVITDVNGCTLMTPDYDIVNGDSDLSLNGTSKGDVDCFGDESGFINLDVSGTATPITFAWSNGATSQNLDGLSPGMYSCIITDAEGCSATTAVIEILGPDAALLSETVLVSSSCTGSENGSIDISVSGGTEPYTFAWSNGAVTEDVDNLALGIYNCTITDDNGCVLVTETYEIISGSGDLEVSSVNIETISCFGTNDGAIDIEPTGTATPFTYSWSNGAQTEDIQMLFSGSYSCVITDANGCVFITESYEVGQPDILEVCASEIDHPLCEGVADGCIALTPCGGTGPYTYAWSNGDTTPNPCGLDVGIYNCTITDVNGCVVISPAFELETAAEPLELDAFEITNAGCGQGAAGAIDITMAGGVEPYTYLWSNGAITEDLADLLVGTYVSTVTDANGCEFITPTFEVENDGSDLMLAAVDPNDVDCFGAETGSIDISVNGTEMPFEFEWSNGSMNEDLENVPSGSYSCTVTDQLGCSIVILNVMIEEPASAVSVDALTATDVTCFGEEDGTVDLTVSGGSGGYTYEWSNGATMEDLEGVGPGDYTCTITDVNGCELVSEVVMVEEPTEVSLQSSVITNETGGSSNGAIDIEVAGGAEPYMYQWDDDNASTSQDLTMVPAGSYTCTVTDANGCTMMFGVFIVQSTDALGNIEQPGFEVYPNPFERQFVIELEEAAQDIQIYDVAGVLLYQDAAPGFALKQELEIGLPAGMYILKVRFSDGRVGLRKIVKE